MTSPTTAELSLPTDLVGQIHPTINVEQLKHYVAAEEKRELGPIGKDAAGHDMYDMDRIVGERGGKTTGKGGRIARREYRIRWQKYGPE